MKLFLILVSILILASIFGISESFAEEKTWYLGEGLKQGDFFSYKICNSLIKNCSDFQMDFWIEGKANWWSEPVWDTEVVIFDPEKLGSGQMFLGRTVPKVFDITNAYNRHLHDFGLSVVWLESFVNEKDGKPIIDPMTYWNLNEIGQTWGNIQGKEGQISVGPTGHETITISAGTFETTVVSWQNNGKTSKIWIVDDFPFPIKGEMFRFLEKNIIKYEFELQGYKDGVEENPFAEKTISVTLEPSILFPEQNTKQILTINVTSFIREENLDPDLLYPIQIWKDDKLIFGHWYGDDDGIFSIFLIPTETNCLESEISLCTEYKSYETSHEGFVIFGDSEIISSVFGKPGKFEVKLAIDYNWDTGYFYTYDIKDPPIITKSFIFNILDGTNEIPPEKEVNPPSLEKLSPELKAPRQQTNSGILPGDVKCKKDLVLIFKFNNSPACVKSSSIQKLVERGWATSQLPYKEIQYFDANFLLEQDQVVTSNFDLTPCEKNDLVWPKTDISFKQAYWLPQGFKAKNFSYDEVSQRIHFVYSSGYCDENFGVNNGAITIKVIPYVSKENLSLTAQEYEDNVNQRLQEMVFENLEIVNSTKTFRIHGNYAGGHEADKVKDEIVSGNGTIVGYEINYWRPSSLHFYDNENTYHKISGYYELKDLVRIAESFR